MAVRAVALYLILVAAVAVRAETTIVGDLQRSADLGFTLAQQKVLSVRRVDAASEAAKAGLRATDRIIAVNGQRFDKAYEGAALLQRHKGDKLLTLAVERDGRLIDVVFTPPSRPLERDDALDIEYGVFTASDGARLRTIVSRPRDALGPLPAIFFTQWVTCGTVETTQPGRERQAAMIRRSGLAFIRVERAGAGDSEGPPCHQLDYDTEVRHYREALAALASHRWVRADKIVIWGESLGATTAPLVAQGRKVAGVLVQGGGALTYPERMLALDRMAVERSGATPAEIHQRMLRSVEFHTEYL